MKQPPDLQQVQKRMRPGMLTRDGFLGSDSRSLAEVLDADDARVRALGLTHRDIANRMEHFTRQGRPGLGTPVEVEDRFEVRVEEWRGVLPCPWPHKGVYRKSITWLTNTRTGQQMQWTALSIHMIGQHGFYGGKGNPYRVDPATAKQVLEI